MKIKKSVTVLAITVIIASRALWAVQLVRMDDAWIVSNAHFQATFDLTRGGVLKAVMYGNKNPFALETGFASVKDGQSEVYSKSGHIRHKPVVQSSAKVLSRVVEESAQKVVLQFSWPIESGGEVVQTVACDDTAAMSYVHDISWNERLNRVEFKAVSSAFQIRKTTIFPEQYALPAVNETTYPSRYPGWKYATDGKRAYGVAIPESGNWSTINRSTRVKSAGAQRVYVGLEGVNLAELPKVGKRTFRHVLMLSSDLGVARKSAASALGEVSRVQLTDIIPEKVHTEIGGGQGARFTLVNNSDKEEDVRLTVEIVSGLDRTLTIVDEELLLKPLQMMPRQVAWTYPKDVEWGVTTRVTLRDGIGRILDYRADVTSVTDFAPAATCIAILNPATCSVEGTEQAVAFGQKMSYVGLFEYYCWAHATWDGERKQGLAPEAESWEAMTENNASRRQRLTKRFIKDLVANCHSNGVHVYSAITGFCNYRMAARHPEMFAYTKEGQLAIYNGKYWGEGARIATAKLMPYSEEAAADWGDQMADSVDMFGWDGCRFDWQFMPSMPNDPLYEGAALADDSDFVTYDWKGRSSKQLWPDADTVAARAVTAWRKAVNRRHPKFVYAVNGYSTDEMFRRAPKHSRAASTHALRLTEYLLNVVTASPTYRSWGEKLTRDTQNVRRCGGQTLVGFMSKLFGGSMGTVYAYHVCHASGEKWWGAPGEMRYWKNARATQPFAVRFGEYFWSPDFLLVPEEVRTREIQVKSAARIYWDQFVYERKSEDGRQVVVHIINVDPDQYITVRQEPSPTRDDVVVEIMPRPGESLVGATALLPGDEPKAVKLEIEGNLVRLPSLDIAESVVLDFVKR